MKNKNSDFLVSYCLLKYYKIKIQCKLEYIKAVSRCVLSPAVSTAPQALHRLHTFQVCRVHSSAFPSLAGTQVLRTSLFFQLVEETIN